MEMKTLNGYEVVDAKAREDIEGLQEAVAAIDVQDSFYLDLTAANETTERIPCDEEMIKFIEAFISRGDVCLYIKDYYDNYYYPAMVTYNASSGLYSVAKTLSLVSAASNIKGDVYSFAKQGSDWKYLIANTFEYTLASKEYVDDAIAALRAELTGGNT